MEEKTKSTLAHIASIVTAIGGIVTAVITSQANDTKGEKIYETLKERVTVQGEHIRILEDEKKTRDAWVIDHLTDHNSYIKNEELPPVSFEEQFKLGAKPDMPSGAPPGSPMITIKPPSIKPKQKVELIHPDELFHDSKQKPSKDEKPAWGQMPSYKSL